jgi:3-deoxy-D-manno-octulosonic acid kinase
MDWTRYTSDPALDAFVPVEENGARMLIRQGYEKHADRLGLHGAPSDVADAVRGGRKSHPVVTLPSGERAVVRDYQRGGALRHLNRERYFVGHRSLEELRVTEHARQAGVRVPEVLAAAEQRVGVGYTATLTTRWIPNAGEFAAWLPGRTPEERARALHEVGRQIGMMHRGGVAHPDLNLRNILVREQGATAYLLDFDRGRLYARSVPPARRASGLQRLARSARKLAAPIDARGWAALREGYGAGWPLRSSLG